MNFEDERSPLPLRGAALLAGIGVGVYTDANDTSKLAATPTLAATPQPVDQSLEEAWIRYQSLYPRLALR